MNVDPFAGKAHSKGKDILATMSSENVLLLRTLQLWSVINLMCIGPLGLLTTMGTAARIVIHQWDWLIYAKKSYTRSGHICMFSWKMISISAEYLSYFRYLALLFRQDDGNIDQLLCDMEGPMSQALREAMAEYNRMKRDGGKVLDAAGITSPALVTLIQAGAMEQQLREMLSIYELPEDTISEVLFAAQARAKTSIGN